MPTKKSAKKPAKKAVKKTAAKKKAAAPKAAPYLYQSKNGATRPKPGGKTARVWEISDELTEKTGQTAIRSEVIALVVKEKIPSATGATQYNLWRVFNGLKGRLTKEGKLKGGKQKPKKERTKVSMPKQTLPKPPKKASGRIGKAKGNIANNAKGKAPKLPKPPAKKATPAPAPEAVPAVAPVVSIAEATAAAQE